MHAIRDRGHMRIFPCQQSKKVGTLVDDSRIAGLAARIRRLAESGDYGAVLDPSAIYEIDQLWDAVRPEEGNLNAIPLNSLAVLAYFHLLRYQLVPRDDMSDLKTALKIGRAHV